MANFPIVAIVGRANVGKSSIFNRLVNTRQAIVADEPGTTRDAVYGRIEVDGGFLALVDTAGLKNPDDELEATIQEQIEEAALAADCIIVVVERGVMLTEEDRRVAKLALKSKKPVILAVNKSEIGTNPMAEEYIKLGIKDIISTSATQNQGFGQLLEAVLQHVTPQQPQNDDILRLALVGRPNVGKSSLFNALVKREQAIVADKAGTTRDVNRAEMTYEQQSLEIFDTAGIRRSGKAGRGIERFSVLRAVQAIEESDICALVIDANEPGVSLDQKVAGMVKDAGKGLIIVMTKWDQIEKDDFTYDQMVSRLRLEFQHVPWAPFMISSAVTGQNVTKIIETAIEIHGERTKQIKTRELNVWLGGRINHHPPAGLKNKHPKLRYITQVGLSPPEFKVFGRHVRVLHWSYKRYLEREMREAYGFEGTPLVLSFSEKEDVT